MRRLLPLLPFAGFLTLFFTFLHRSYPFVGHDYFLFVPRLMAGQWHAARQGLWPLLYSPHLCGGVPLYGNPEDIFYSLVQLFSFALPVWPAVQATLLVCLCLGYWGWFRMGKDALGLRASWAHVLALCCVSQGFYLLHVQVGHMTFHYWPLLGWLAWAVFAERGTVRFATRLAVFALVATAVLYAGGAMILTVFSLFFPFAIIGYPLLRNVPFVAAWRTLVGRLAACSLAALLCSAGKLTAFGYHMRFFPRTVPFDELNPEGSTLWFVTKALFAAPQQALLFLHESNPVWGFYHEYSIGLSHVVLLGLVVAAFLWLKNLPVASRSRLLGIWFLALCTVVFFVQLARGYGVFIGWLEYLPLYGSVHVVARYLSTFGLLLSAVGVVALQQASALWAGRWSTYVPAWCAAASVASFALLYGLPVSGEHLSLTFNVREFEGVLAKTPQWLQQPVVPVRFWREQNGSDVQHFLAGSTGDCSVPLLSMGSAVSLPPLRDGLVTDVADGTYNMRNPACLLYPEANDCRPGDNIRESDGANMMAFISGEPVSWKQPFWQHVANVTGVLALLFCVGSSLRIASGRFQRHG